ncbi:MAG: DinB family protein [Planctomycetota bacterium]
MARGIAADRFARFPIGASGPVRTNHPAFVYGHLTLYPARALHCAGLESNPLRPPEGFEDLFGPNAECRDDAEGTLYPGMDQVKSALYETTELCLEIIEGMKDEDLETPTAIERYRERFPTAGEAVAFLLGAHAAFHLGQVSAWRRIEGLGPAF